MLWLVAGLGNPGPKYFRSRHNLGFWTIDLISAKRGIPLPNKSHQAFWGEGRMGQVSIILLKPQTFMNLSGISIRGLMDSQRIDPSHLILIHDDMDLAVGGSKISYNVGSGGHRGVQSVIDAIETKEFLRIRFGIGRPDPEEDPTDFVLGSCPESEQEKLLPLIQKTDKMLEVIFDNGPKAAMNLFNH